MLVAACGAGAGPRVSTSSPSSTAAGPARAAGRSAGCGQPAAPGSKTQQLEVAGHRRTVIVHLPTRYRRSHPTALVLDLHGSGSTAAEQEVFSGMDATSDQDGFVVAYPQGLLASGSGYDWNVPGVPLADGRSVPPGSADDIAFLAGVVPALAGRYCIDDTRVFATGMSGGGRMASQLACDASSTFAAVAPVAGLRFPEPCPASRAVPVIAFHGQGDPVDPYGGGGQGYWTYSVPVAAQRWAAHNECGSSPQVSSGQGFSLAVYPACSGAAAVELYTLTGEGHEWPGGPAMPRRITNQLGPQSSAVDADATMWAFFSTHPLPCDGSKAARTPPCA